MKSILKIMLLVCTVVLVGTVTSCKHDHGPESHTHNEDGTVDKSGTEWTSDYICPMHCKGSGSDKVGTCPVCKMKLVANKDKMKADDHSGHDHGAEGHDHSGHDHSGHDHGDHEGHDH